MMVALSPARPPVVMESGVERLMDDDMLQVRDLVLETAIEVAGVAGVRIERLSIRELNCRDEDWSKVIFEARIAESDEAAFAYWEAVDAAVWEGRYSLPKSALRALEENATIFVRW